MVVSTFAMEQSTTAGWLFTFKVMYAIIETQKKYSGPSRPVTYIPVLENGPHSHIHIKLLPTLIKVLQKFVLPERDWPVKISTYNSNVFFLYQWKREMLFKQLVIRLRSSERKSLRRIKISLEDFVKNDQLFFSPKCNDTKNQS